MQPVEKRLEIGRMLGGMMEKSKIFCDNPKTIRKEATEYITDTDL